MSDARTLPPDFETRVEAELGAATAGRLLNALHASSPATPAVRLNRGKHAEAGKSLCEKAIAWSGGEGRYVKGQRPVFAFDPAWHAGLYYVQDASSMALSAAVGELSEALGSAPLRYLDACAAPGGKTIAAIEALPEGSVVVANEFDRRRAGILVENIEKWGEAAAAVSCGDTAAFRKLPVLFDIVAVDAPCSGEGMMRKEPEAVAQWSPALVSECAALQREILANVWETLKPGGYLIYSTCTFGREENEDNVAWAEKELGAVRIPLRSMETAEGPLSLETATYRFMPGFVDGEGLFMAVLQKPGTLTPGTATDKQNKKASRKGARHEGGQKPDPQAAALCQRALGEGYSLQSRPDGSFTAMPRQLAEIAPLLDRHLHLRLCGTALGTMKGKDITPAHALALCSKLRSEAFPRVDVDEAEALAYLRGESLTLPESAPRGIVLLTSAGGAPIGFVKNLGNRANNLFPQALRLKTMPGPDHQPADIARKSSQTNLTPDK
ncbi:MAG: hypothetical protein K2L96_08565 [Muribaculaceae bacterium]|nr:hypothetical protein [Muribaculaceae bacterium]